MIFKGRLAVEKGKRRAIRKALRLYLRDGRRADDSVEWCNYIENEITRQYRKFDWAYAEIHEVLYEYDRWLHGYNPSELANWL